MTAQEIDLRIQELEGSLKTPEKHPTEIYTRIVGYYRSLANWNAGKREEYNHRKTYLEDDVRIDAALGKQQSEPHEVTTPPTENGLGPVVSYRLFTKKTCPNCPAMKAKTALLTWPGTEFDVETETGFELAVQYSVTTTPTLILFDGDGNEVARIMSATEWDRLKPHFV